MLHITIIGQVVSAATLRRFEIHRALSDLSGRLPRMTRRKAPMIAVLVVLVLVAALLGGELYVRQQIKSCLAGQLENELGSEVEVGLGWKPILISLVDKQVSSVTLDSNDARFGPAVDMTVSAIATA